MWCRTAEPTRPVAPVRMRCIEMSARLESGVEGAGLRQRFVVGEWGWVCRWTSRIREIGGRS
jgi:hypothetical protein